jgi:hypothetical protein
MRGFADWSGQRGERWVVPKKLSASLRGSCRRGWYVESLPSMPKL